MKKNLFMHLSSSRMPHLENNFRVNIQLPNIFDILQLTVAGFWIKGERLKKHLS